MPRGVVTRIVPEKGFCFVRCDDGIHVFCHAIALINVRFEVLLVGDRVTFDTEPDPKRNRWRAKNVHLVEERSER